MYWYTKTEQYLNWVRLNQSGAAQPGINEKKYSNLIVLVPPINKQKIFIEFVKQCDKLKFALKDSIESLSKIYTNIISTNLG